MFSKLSFVDVNPQLRGWGTARGGWRAGERGRKRRERVEGEGRKGEGEWRKGGWRKGDGERGKGGREKGGREKGEKREGEGRKGPPVPPSQIHGQKFRFTVACDDPTTPKFIKDLRCHENNSPYFFPVPPTINWSFSAPPLSIHSIFSSPEPKAHKVSL